MLKEVTEKYSRELDGFIRELRKKLSHSEVTEDAERLLKYVEDEFFGSELAGRVEYWEICDMCGRCTFASGVSTESCRNIWRIRPSTRLW